MIIIRIFEYDQLFVKDYLSGCWYGSRNSTQRRWGAEKNNYTVETLPPGYLPRLGHF